jgi:hypothetical protein
MAKDLLFKLRSVTFSNEERRRDIAAELEARGRPVCQDWMVELRSAELRLNTAETAGVKKI